MQVRVMLPDYSQWDLEAQLLPKELEESKAFGVSQGHETK